MAPALSLLVPVRNGMRYLEHALRSALAQTFSDWELILSDNASTDDTLRIARSFADPRIRIVSQPRNIGMVANWQACADEASAPWILFLSHDDLLYPACAERLYERVSRDQSLGFAFAGVKFVDDQGRPWQDYLPDLPPRLSGEDYVHASLLEARNVTHSGSCLLRREALREIGGFDRSVGIFHDWNAYLRIALRNPVGYVREPLSGYRCHLKNASVRFESPAAHAQELMRALRGLFRERPDLDAGGRAAIHRLALRYAR
jgi:glycosyltransferase involved in cell wall biosynthesis